MHKGKNKIREAMKSMQGEIFQNKKLGTTSKKR
jgi:hypothetical protein